MSHIVVQGLEVEEDRLIGDDGFLSIRRVRLRNRRDDGSLSPPYPCDFISRPYGLDAVVVAVYQRQSDWREAGRIRVLLRECLRPALVLGRAPGLTPVPEPHRSLFLTELVAGIVEQHDTGLDGIRSRAAEEVREEAGYDVEPAAVVFLGQGSFPSPGSLAEKFWLTAVEIQDPSQQHPLDGDGSPMEEGATTRWVDLEDAIAACVRGEIEDCKTELTLRRLRDWSAQDAAQGSSASGDSSTPSGQ